MTFDEIKKEAERLAPHDKLILAQIMLQMAIREQENKDAEEKHPSYDIENIKRSIEKLKPGNQNALRNSVKTCKLPQWNIGWRGLGDFVYFKPVLKMGC